MPLRVLIAEDEWLVAEMLRQQLESQGYQVIRTVGTGPAAVDACCREHPDLVLMDVQMPYMDGLEATRRVMEACPTPIIILTGRNELEQSAERVGAMDCVSKPLLGHDVVDLVAKAQHRFAQFRLLMRRGAHPEQVLRDWVVLRQAVRALMNGGGRMSEQQAVATLQELARAGKISLVRAAHRVLARASAQKQLRPAPAIG